MEREFQRRAEEAARHDDEEEDDQVSGEVYGNLLSQLTYVLIFYGWT